MQQLHLVGFTTDLEGLIFSARRGSKSGGFVVGLDEDLLAMVEEALRLRGDEPDDDTSADDGEGDERHPASGLARRRAPKPESGLSPREIQARLRGGRTIAEVAKEAGVDEEWVTRFADPILAEQAQVVGRARSMVFTKPRLGESAQDLLTSVLWNLADRGMSLTEAEFEGGWSAYHARESTWVVRFTYISRRRPQVAEWEVDLGEEELHARNRLASDLGYVEPGRRRRRVTFAPEDEQAEAAPAASQVTKRPGAKKKSAAKKVVKRPLARKPAAKTATAKRAAAKKAATAKKAAAKKAATAKKATAKKAAAKKAAAKKAAGKKAAVKKAAAKKAAATKKSASKKTAPRRTATKTTAAKKKAPVRKAAASKRTATGTGRSSKQVAPTSRTAKKSAERVAASASRGTESRPRDTVGRAPAVMPSPSPVGGRRPAPRPAVSRASILPQPVTSSSRTVVPQPVVSRSTATPFTPQPSAQRPGFRPVPSAEPRPASAPRPEPRPASSQRTPAQVTESFPRPAASEPVRAERRPRPPADDKPRVVFDDVAGVVEGDVRPVVRIRADQAGPSAGDARQPRRRRIRPSRG